MKTYSKTYKIFLIIYFLLNIVALIYIGIKLFSIFTMPRSPPSYQTELLIAFVLLITLDVLFAVQIYHFRKFYNIKQSEDKVIQDILNADFPDCINEFITHCEKKYHTKLNAYLQTVSSLETLSLHFPETKDLNDYQEENVCKLKLDSNILILIPEENDNNLVKSLEEDLKKVSKIIESKLFYHSNLKYLTEKEKYIEKLGKAMEYTERILATSTIEEAYYVISEFALTLFDADSVTILDVSKGKGAYNFVFSRKLDASKLEKIQKNINSPYYGEHIDNIVRTGHLNYINNTEEFQGWFSSPNDIKSWLGIPILDIEQKVFLVVNIGKNVPNFFVEEDLKLAEIFAKNINIAVLKNRLLEEYREESITDHLTGLYNRREFEDRLSYEIQEAKKYNKKLSLIMMDLDRFKKFNDTYGHPLGDELLKEFARVLRESIRASDSVFRIGGDEFAAILVNANRAKATEVASRIKEKIKKIKLAPNFEVDASFGIKEYKGESAKELVEECDKLLYLDKIRKN